MTTNKTFICLNKWTLNSVWLVVKTLAFCQTVKQWPSILSRQSHSLQTFYSMFLVLSLSLVLFLFFFFVCVHLIPSSGYTCWGILGIWVPSNEIRKNYLPSSMVILFRHTERLLYCSGNLCGWGRQTWPSILIKLPYSCCLK